MKNYLLFTFLALFCDSYTPVNPAKDRLIDFSFRFYKKNKVLIAIKILHDKNFLVSYYQTNNKTEVNNAIEEKKALRTYFIPNKKYIP